MDDAEQETDDAKRTREIWETVREEQYESECPRLSRAEMSAHAERGILCGSHRAVAAHAAAVLYSHARTGCADARYVVVACAQRWKACSLTGGHVAAHLEEIPAALGEYRALRTSLANRKRPLEHDSDDDDDEQQPRGRKAFSSASLTPVTDTTPADSSSASSASTDDDQPSAADGHPPRRVPGSGAVPQLSSRALISRVALLATDALRASNEKMNLADAAYTSVRPHRLTTICGLVLTRHLHGAPRSIDRYGCSMRLSPITRVPWPWASVPEHVLPP